MEDTLLQELIEKINKIYYSQQYDVVYECMNLLNLHVYEYEQDEIELKTPFYVDLKDIFTKRIIEEIEKRITSDQKQIFYSGISEVFIKYTSSDDEKKKTISNSKILDYYGRVQDHIVKLVYSLEDDQYKIDFINKYRDVLSLSSLRIILCSIKNDRIKQPYMDIFIDEPDELGQLLLSFDDDDLKLELYEKYKEALDDELKYDRLVCSLKRDDLKLEALGRINYKSRLSIFDKLIYSINNEDNLLSLWDKVDIDGKVLIIYKIKDIDKRFELFKRLNNDLENNPDSKQTRNIYDLINELPLEKINYIIKECPNIKLGTMALISICQLMNDESGIIELLKIRGSKKVSRIVRKDRLLSTESMLKNVNLFLDLEQVENKDKILEYINYLYQDNNDILYTIDWDILQPKYIDVLGLDKINIIGSFDELIKLLLDMTDQEYEAFYRVLDHYIKSEGLSDWQYAAYQIMQEIYFNKVDKKELCNYITDFNNVNIDNLLYILLNGDNFGIKSLDDINNYHNLVREKCDKDIESDDLSLIKDTIFIKYFGLSDRQSLLRGFRGQIKNGMGRIYNMYHKDIDLIENEELKELFRFIETVNNSTSKEELISIYKATDDFGHIDTYKLERLLKNEILKLYNKTLFQLDGLIPNSEGLIEAGVDFSMITTSVGAYVKNNPDNYMKDWNKASLASGHFCASYIRNDMLGTAPVPHFMYGFTSMEPNALLLSGSTDIYSSGASFVSKAFNGEEYLGPDNQINNTAYNKKYTYNEMDFRRIQGGKKKQPDYILVFKRNGVIDNIDEARKASQDWNGLPIVVVDVDLCLKSEKGKVEHLLKEYYKTPTVELYNSIKTKIMNNRVTDASFLENIDLEELKQLSVSDSTKSKIV